MSDWHWINSCLVKSSNWSWLVYPGGSHSLTQGVFTWVLDAFSLEADKIWSDAKPLDKKKNVYKNLHLQIVYKSVFVLQCCSDFIYSFQLLTRVKRNLFYTFDPRLCLSIRWVAGLETNMTANKSSKAVPRAGGGKAPRDVPDRSVTCGTAVGAGSYPVTPHDWFEYPPDCPVLIIWFLCSTKMAAMIILLPVFFLFAIVGIKRCIRNLNKCPTKLWTVSNDLNQFLICRWRITQPLVMICSI